MKPPIDYYYSPRSIYTCLGAALDKPFQAIGPRPKW